VSNELSNYGGVNGQPRLDDPGSFGAPAMEIDAHLACFTPKRSLVRTQYRPHISHLVRGTFPGTSSGYVQHTRKRAGVKPDRWALWSITTKRPRWHVASIHRGLDGTGVRLALIIHHSRVRPYQRCRHDHHRANPTCRHAGRRPHRLADRANDHHTGPLPRGSQHSHAAARRSIHDAGRDHAWKRL
jgi:hypothetical protein